MKTIERTRQAARAINIRKTFGARSAARYLYRRGWSLSAALWLVAGAALREGYDDISPWELTQAEDAHILNHYEDYYKA